MPHVVVIGAGVSGLTAARQLSQSPSFKVTVVEATSRLGGRIKSVDFDGVHVDMGASWMHETRANPLFAEGLKQRWALKYTDVTTRYFTERGELPRKSGVPQIVGEIQAVVSEYFHQGKPLVSPHQPLASFVRERVLPGVPLVTDQQKRWAELMFRQVEHFIGLKWSEIPADEGGDQSPLGRDAYVLGKGYSVVVDWLLRDINKERATFVFDQPVVEVGRAPTSERFSVKTSTAVYEADYVICTIPLGALKRSPRMFEGLKPGVNRVLDTVASTNLAALGKVVAQFPSVEWDAECDSFCVANEVNDEIVTIINPFASNILVALTGPDLTQRIESDPENAYAKVRWAFEAISNRKVADPVRVAVSDWTQSEFFGCSYSARSIGQSFDSAVEGFIEGCGKLRFAGEHTTLDGNGCVHGAYLSALREVELIKAMETQ